MKFNEHDTQPYDWDAEGVYVIEPTDPVEGGPDGVSNCQAKELTRRTRNLHTRMTVAEGEIDTLQEQTPLQVAAALASANTYTDGKDTVLRSDMAIADTAAIRAAKDYADQVVAALVDNSPEALNTLQELAKALGDDPNFSTTVMTEIGKRMKTDDVTAALAGKVNTGDMNTALASKLDKEVVQGDYKYYQGLDEEGVYLEIIKISTGATLVQLRLKKDGRLQLFDGVDREVYHSGNDSGIYMNRDWVGDADQTTAGGAYGYSPSSTNCPATYGTLFVVNYSGFVSQIAYQTESTNIWYRQRTNNGPWQPWRLMYHSGNLGAATQGAAGLMSPADKTKLDTLQSAPLAAYKIAGNGYILMASGPYHSTQTIYKNGSGDYLVYHNIGNTNYYTMVIAQGYRGHVGQAILVEENTNSVRIGTTDMNGEFWDLPFQVVLMPKN